MAFIPGLTLSEMFYHEIVKPIIQRHYPHLKYAAGLIGHGSEVLGLDDEVSTDHHWGPRLQLFLQADDVLTHAQPLTELFSEELPPTFKGFSTNWSEPDDKKQQFLIEPAGNKINHRIEIWTVGDIMKHLIGISSLKIDDLCWLSIPEQGLLEFTAGKVFHDETGELTKARAMFKYFPDNVWRFMLTSEWVHYAEEAAFIGRAGSRDDDLGSRLVTSRIAYRLMRIAFAISKKYVPYMKWIGTMFARLPISEKLGPMLESALKSNDWRERERLICDACLLLANAQARIGIVTNVNVKSCQYFGRDQVIVDVGEIINALKDSLKGKLKVMEHSIGTINQFIDDVNILTDPVFTSKLLSFNNL